MFLENYPAKARLIQLILSGGWKNHPLSKVSLYIEVLII